MNYEVRKSSDGLFFLNSDLRSKAGRTRMKFISRVRERGEVNIERNGYGQEVIGTVKVPLLPDQCIWKKL